MLVTRMSNKFKTIALVSTSFPITHDGSEAAGSFVQDFAIELSRQGVKVIVIAPIVGTAKTIVYQGITVCYFSVKRLPLSTINILNPFNWYSLYLALKNGQQKVNQIVVQYETEHIFALWALPSGYWANIACKKFNIDYSTWCLGSDIWSLSKLPLVKQVLVNTLKESKIIYSDGLELSRRVTKLSSSECHFMSSSRHFVNNEKNLKKPNNNGKFTFVFIGRWHKNKGVDLLLDTLNLLDDKDWSLIDKVYFAGGGPLKEVVDYKIAKLINENRPIRLFGYINKNQAKKLIIESDYLLIPSRIESIPVIFSDAMQCYTPVISTPVGDLPHLIKQYKCGLLAEDVTSVAFFKQIKKALYKHKNNYNFNKVKELFSVVNNTKLFLKNMTLDGEGR